MFEEHKKAVFGVFSDLPHGGSARCAHQASDRDCDIDSGVGFVSTSRLYLAPGDIAVFV
jgi:hypothetical protein